jgi:hypothetical protein
VSGQVKEIVKEMANTLSIKSLDEIISITSEVRGCRSKRIYDSNSYKFELNFMTIESEPCEPKDSYLVTIRLYKNEEFEYGVLPPSNLP